MRISKAYLRNIVNEEMRSMKNSEVKPLDQMAPGGVFFEIVKGYLDGPEGATSFCQTLQESGDSYEGLIETIATFNLDPQSGDHIIKAHDKIFGARFMKDGRPPQGHPFVQDSVNDLTQYIREGKKRKRPKYPQALEQGLAEEEEEVSFFPPGTGFYFVRLGRALSDKERKPSPEYHKESFEGEGKAEQFAEEVLNQLESLPGKDSMGRPIRFNVYEGDPKKHAEEDPYPLLQVIGGEIIPPEASDTEREYSLERYHGPEGGHGEDTSGYIPESKIKITKSHIAKIINEEISNVLKEVNGDPQSIEEEAWFYAISPKGQSVGGSQGHYHGPMDFAKQVLRRYTEWKSIRVYDQVPGPGVEPKFNLTQDDLKGGKRAKEKRIMKNETEAEGDVYAKNFIEEHGLEQVKAWIKADDEVFPEKVSDFVPGHLNAETIEQKIITKVS
tara:strand:- start:462 stop:1790 length:1329 start_codon:yes stop_codon:yes gene_type:complete